MEESVMTNWWKWIGSRLSLFVSVYLLAVMASQWGLTGSSSAVPGYALIIAFTAVLGISGLVSEIVSSKHNH
jgi:hypothetical protein